MKMAEQLAVSNLAPETRGISGDWRDPLEDLIEKKIEHGDKRALSRRQESTHRRRRAYVGSSGDNSAKPERGQIGQADDKKIGKNAKAKEGSMTSQLHQSEL